MSPSIDQLLTIACSKGASDLHIKAGSFPFMRINGDLQPMVEAQRLAATATVADLITRPAVTPLLEFARLQGCRTVSGADMFAVQAGYMADILLGTKQ